MYWWWKDRQIIEKICDNPETYLVYIPKDAEKVGVDVYCRSGISIEQKEVFGVGHLLEHYISEIITRDHQGDFYSNGRINHEMMNLYVRLDRDRKKELIEKFFDKVFKVEFNDQEILNYEKLAIQNELNTDSHNLVRRIERKVETGRFQDECFCIKSFEDSIEPTGRMTLKNVEDHYRQIFNRQNVKIFISVYSPAAWFKSYLKELLPKYKLPEGKRTEFPDCVYSDRHIKRMPNSDIAGSYAYLTYPALRSADDPKDKIVMRMILDLLTGREDGYSVNKWARKQGIYAINSYWVRMEKIGFIVFNSYIPKEKNATVLNIINQSIKKVCTQPITQDYLKKEIRDLTNVYRREWRSNDRTNWVIDETLDAGQYRELEYYLDLLESITPEDIMNLANEIFDHEKMNLYIYGEQPAETDEELLDLLKGNS